MSTATASDRDPRHAHEPDPSGAAPYDEKGRCLKCIGEARAEIARLRKALEPFAAAWDAHGDDPDATFATVTVGDFRRARAALRGETA